MQSGAPANITSCAHKLADIHVKRGRALIAIVVIIIIVVDVIRAAVDSQWLLQAVLCLLINHAVTGTHHYTNHCARLHRYCVTTYIHVYSINE